MILLQQPVLLLGIPSSEDISIVSQSIAVLQSEPGDIKHTIKVVIVQGGGNGLIDDIDLDVIDPPNFRNPLQ